MKKHHVVMVTGLILGVIGFIWGRTYYIYPDDMAKTITENLAWFSCLILGAILLLVGTRMGDGK